MLHGRCYTRPKLRISNELIHLGSLGLTPTLFRKSRLPALYQLDSTSGVCQTVHTHIHSTNRHSDPARTHLSLSFRVGTKNRRRRGSVSGGSFIMKCSTGGLLAGSIKTVVTRTEASRAVVPQCWAIQFQVRQTVLERMSPYRRASSVVAMES